MFFKHLFSLEGFGTNITLELHYEPGPVKLIEIKMKVTSLQIYKYL